MLVTESGMTTDESATQHENALLAYTDHTDYEEYILDSIEKMTRDIAGTARLKGFQRLLDLFI